MIHPLVDLHGVENWSDSAIEYWSRPFLVRVECSHVAGTCMFMDEASALDYIYQQAENTRKDIARSGRLDWVNMDLRQTYLGYPDGSKVQARYILFLEKLASH